MLPAIRVIFHLSLNHHARPEFHALEKGLDVMVMHSDTSLGYGLTYAGGVIRSMNTIMWDRESHPATTKGTSWIDCFSDNGVVTVRGGGGSFANRDGIMIDQSVSFIKLESTKRSMDFN